MENPSSLLELAYSSEQNTTSEELLQNLLSGLNNSLKNSPNPPKGEDPPDESAPPTPGPRLLTELPDVDQHLWVRDWVDPPADVPANMTPVLEEIYKLRQDLGSFKKEVASAFASMDFKKVKKNRTLKNRCTFVNRRGESCRGYICKVPGSQLCYAHHILSSSACYPEKRKKLY